MKLLMVISGCFTALCLVPPALDWRSPLLSSVRPLAFTGLVGLSICLIVIQAWTLRTSRPGQRLLKAFASLGLIAALAALIATLALEGKFRVVRCRVLEADPVKLEILGRHLIVGYRNPAEARELVKLGGIAGLYVSSNNVQGKSVAAIKEEIRSFQNLRQAQGLPPLWIATDQEGGIVSRMSPPLLRRPALSEIVALHSDVSQRERAVRRYARGQGRGLAEMGINLNFAPVVDVNYRVVNPADRLTRIHERAISGDPAVVAQVAGWYCAALEETGVRCTLKHFPGLGRVYEDTHVNQATLTASVAELNDSDWVPFRSLMSRSSAFTMLGHVRVKSVDADGAASFSPAIVRGLIRGDWKYDGVLITDNFTMQAVYRSECGIDKAGVRAINAGVDLILISYDPDQYYRVMYSLLTAERQGKLRGETLKRSDRRLARSMVSLQNCRKENGRKEFASHDERLLAARPAEQIR